MRSRLWKGMLQFWTSDRSLPIFLLLLIFVVFILPVAASPGPLGRLTSDVVLSLLLVAGAMAAAEPRWVRRIVPPIAALALLVRWASAATSSADLAMWRELSMLVTLMLFAIVVATQVFRRGRVTPQRIQGAVAVYLLLGLAWASAYELLYLASGSIRRIGQRCLHVADLDLFQLRHAHDHGLRRYHACASHRPFARRPGGTERPGLSDNHAGPPGWAAARIARRRLTEQPRKGEPDYPAQYPGSASHTCYCQ